MPSALAMATDFIHIAAMVVWAVGLPLLVCHRWPKLSLAYTVYAIVFVIVSQLSHYTLGECFLTTVSRYLWEAAGDGADGTFTGRLVIMVAGVRPRRESAVLAWEIAITLTSIAVCWSLYQRYRRRQPRDTRGSLGHPC